MLVSSPNGAYFIPAQGYIRPANVPTNLMGLVLVNFYDSEGRELRNRVPIMLLGNGTPNGQQPVPQSVLSQTQASQPVTQTPLFPLPGAAGSVRTAGPQTSALPPPPSPRPAGLPPPPPLPPEAVALPSVADPDLSRELMMAQTTQLRSLTLQAEEAAGSAIDLEKMSVLRDANYTREVGEAFQLNSAATTAAAATTGLRGDRHLDVPSARSGGRGLVAEREAEAGSQRASSRAQAPREGPDQWSRGIEGRSRRVRQEEWSRSPAGVTIRPSLYRRSSCLIWLRVEPSLRSCKPASWLR